MIIATGILFANGNFNACAELKLSGIFSDNMVLQQQRPVPVWGWTKPGEKVTVKFKGQAVTAVAGKDGKWIVKLRQLKADFNPAKMEIISSSGRKIFKNVVVGEVWLCSGQSNMAFSVVSLKDGKQQIAAANYPKIRLFTLSGKTSDLPLETIQPRNSWHVCTPRTIARFSAIGYFFGRVLNRELQVPVGLIDSSIGCSFAEAWTSYEGLKSEKALKPIFERHIKMMQKETFTKRVVQWQKDFVAWNNLPESERKKWPVIVKWHKKKRPPYGYPGNPDAPSWLYNAMINPLIPFGIKGVIWYQGESNVPRPHEYAALFPTMIKDWRSRWSQGDFPFYFVQIAPCKEFDSGKLTELWMAQYKTAREIKKCGMVSAIDVGDINNPHPSQKEPVGARLAMLALSQTYGKKGFEYKNPSFKRIKAEGEKIRVFFINAGSGLVSREGKPLSWFEIAGKDGKYHKAIVVIDGKTVVVSSPEVKIPVSVRFAWSKLAEPNLNAKNGIPVLPFNTERTDKR